MKLRILCNWMTPASNIAIQSEFGSLAIADVLWPKPIFPMHAIHLILSKDATFSSRCSPQPSLHHRNLLGATCKQQLDTCPSPSLCGTDTLESQATAHLRWQQGLRGPQITPDGWQNWGELQIHRIMKSLGPSARLIVYINSQSAITSANGCRDRFQKNVI